MISYTTTDLVYALGDTRSPNTKETSVMDSVVVAVSRRIDSWLSQIFAFNTYTAEVMRAQIDADGVIQCWPATPTMSAPTAVAWKFAASSQWNDISGGTFEIDQSISGCQFRVLNPNLISYRGNKVQLRLTFTGGWATLDAVPEDFEYCTRRACWIEYKKREQTDQGKTAIPALGVVVTPSAWPADLRSAFTPYRRLVS